MLQVSLYALLAGAACLSLLCLVRRPAVRHTLAAAVILGCGGFLLWYFCAAYFFNTTAIVTNLAVTLLSLSLFYTFLLQAIGYRRQKKLMHEEQWAAAQYVFRKGMRAGVSESGEPGQPQNRAEAVPPGGPSKAELPVPAGPAANDVPADAPTKPSTRETQHTEEELLPTPAAPKASEEERPAAIQTIPVPVVQGDAPSLAQAAVAEQRQNAARAETVEMVLRLLRALAKSKGAALIAVSLAADAPAEPSDRESSHVEERMPTEPKEAEDGTETTGGMAAYRRDMGALRTLVFGSEDYHAAIEKVFEILGAGYGLPKEELRRMAAVLRLLRERCRHGLPGETTENAGLTPDGGNYRAAAAQMAGMPDDEYALPKNELRRIEIVLQLLDKRCS